jgi:transcriptional/translational regulatory protein YebC/TACO1
MQVKNQQITINIEKLKVISQFEKGEQIFYICHNVRCVHISVRTICDNANRITESHELKRMCSKTTTVLSESEVTKGTDVSLLYFYWIINKYFI